MDYSSIDHFKSYQNEFSDSLNLDNFKQLLSDLFTDYDEQNGEYLFNLFDQDQDGRLNEKEFNCMWSKWIEKLFKLKYALIVVDMQNDFINGSLAIKDGVDCVPIINRLIKDVKFHKLIYTFDCHPNDHISFLKNVSNYEVLEVNGDRQFDKKSIKMFDKVKFKLDEKIIEQILWPVHCVQNSDGAKLYPHLIGSAELNDSDKLNYNKDLNGSARLDKNEEQKDKTEFNAIELDNFKTKSIRIFKGNSRDVDSYSAFFDNSKISKTQLDDQLKQNEIDILFISGLATDYCVGETAKDAIDLGYLTILIEDACKGVDQKRIELTKLELKNKECLFVSSAEVDDIVNSKVRKFEIALQLAKKIRF